MSKSISKLWIAFLAFSLACGIALRTIHVQDMEYKEDEEYNFVQSQKIGSTDPLPCCGIPSGVYLVNPGMSIWIFAGLAKLTHARTPTDLARALQLFSLIGMLGVLPFVHFFIQNQKEKLLWLWSFCLAMVNPFLILYQRKLWPEPFLPLFTLLTLAGWWRREKKWGAFIWGFVGCILGQIHMSGFFFSGGLFFWTVLFARMPKIKWLFWFVGSCLAGVPLIPWLNYIFTHPVGHAISTGWSEALQLKYWVFWFTDPLGLHLGNTLGINRGPTQLDQLSDFIRYPVFHNQATYLVGLAHLLAFMVAVLIYVRGRKRILSLANTPTDFVINASFVACGILMTCTGIMIRRYYMAVTFPLEFVFLSKLADPGSRRGRQLLLTLWICELCISSHFVAYIHLNQGSESGDYGKAYHLLK